MYPILARYITHLMSCILDILPTDVVTHLMTFLTELDLVVMMYVCKFTKRASVRMLETDRKSLIYVNLCEESARFGYLEILKWLRSPKMRYVPSSTAYEMACQGGHLEVIRWLYNLGVTYDLRRMSGIAALGGHLEVIKWIMEQNKMNYDPSKDYDIWSSAAEGGHLHILMWIHQQPESSVHKCACTCAFKNNHMEIIKWAEQLSEVCGYDYSLCRKAARYGKIESVKELYQKNSSVIDVNVILAAARGGHLEIIIWAIHIIKNDFTNRYRIYIKAAKGGHTKVMDWAFENKISMNTATYYVARQAIQRGHLGVLQWLEDHNFMSQRSGPEYLQMKNQYIIDSCVSELCSSAAYLGHLQILKWLKDRGFQDENSFYVAIKNGQLEVLHYLIDNNITPNPNITNGLGTVIITLTCQEAEQITKWIRLNKNSYYTWTIVRLVSLMRVQIKRHQENFKRYT